MSSPLPPIRISLPAPPSSMSLPLPPSRMSLPAPPLIVSLPLPPETMSLPAPALTVSLPLPALMMSPALVPVMVSLPLPPVMIMGSYPSGEFEHKWAHARTAQTCGGVNGGRGLEVSENVPATENDFAVLVTALIIWKHLSGRPECGFTHLGKDPKKSP